MADRFPRLCLLLAASLLAVFLFGCKDREPTEPGQDEGEAEEEEEESTGLTPTGAISKRVLLSEDPWFESFRPTPFGSVLEGLDQEALQHRYPELVRSAVAPSALDELLPPRLVGLDRTRVYTGVMANEGGAWVATVAEYQGDGATVNLTIQDTAWEPTLLNPALKNWREAHYAPLEDGRPLGRVGGEIVPGTVFAVPSREALPTRLLIVGHARDKTGPELLQRAIESIPPWSLTSVSEHKPESATWTGGSLLPPKEELARLAEPAALMALLPAKPAGSKLLSEEHGFRVNPELRVVAEARRISHGEHGLTMVELQDLGAKESPVLSPGPEGTAPRDATGEDPEKSADSAASPDGQTQCSDEFASCRLTTTIGDRLLYTLTWPSSLRTDAPPKLIEAFDRKAAADVLP
ncbi:MAG: hypothetical protein VX498_06640 [Myxococcota bacterium]|nr:hypothetical protein [Myxococcota bacterium]